MRERYDIWEVQLHSHRQSYKKGPVMNQNTTARGYAIQVALSWMGCLSRGIIPKDPSGGSSLNTLTLKFMHVILGVRVPYWSNILQLGSYNGQYAFSLSEVVCVLRFLLWKPSDLFAVLGFCYCSMLCCALLCVHSSFAIILMKKRELVTLLCLSS